MVKKTHMMIIKVKKLVKKKKKNKKIWAEFIPEDEYGTNSNCDICNANLEKRPYYELSHSGYISICTRCARALQRARIIRLREPKPPPKLLSKDKFFYGSPLDTPIRLDTPFMEFMPLSGKNKVIERHPK